MINSKRPKGVPVIEKMIAIKINPFFKEKDWNN